MNMQVYHGGSHLKKSQYGDRKELQGVHRTYQAKKTFPLSRGGTGDEDQIGETEHPNESVTWLPSKKGWEERVETFDQSA